MIPLTTTQASQWVTDACNELKQCHDAAWNLIQTRKVARSQWEAWLVAHVCSAMCGIAAAWKPRLALINPRLRLSASSVFTHQSPYVRWATGRCELSDLMIAFIDRRTAPGVGFAILIQAKQADNSPARLTTPSEKLQFQLLSRRPVFDVDTSSAPKNVQLPSSRSGHDEAILYGVNPPKNVIANPPPWSNHRWHTGGSLASASVANQVTMTKCFAETLVEQVRGREGWDFALPPAGSDWQHFLGPPRDDWPMLINYLLETTFKKPLKSFRNVIKQQNRGRDIALFMQTRPIDGRVMSLYHYAPDKATAGRALSWITPVADDEGDWYPVSNSPLFELGGGGGGNQGRDAGDDEGPDDGPISAVVFELSEAPEIGHAQEPHERSE